MLIGGTETDCWLSVNKNKERESDTRRQAGRREASQRESERSIRAIQGFGVRIDAVSGPRRLEVLYARLLVQSVTLPLPSGKLVLESPS